MWITSDVVDTFSYKYACLSLSQLARKKEKKSMSMSMHCMLVITENAMLVITENQKVPYTFCYQKVIIINFLFYLETRQLQSNTLQQTHRFVTQNSTHPHSHSNMIPTYFFRGFHWMINFNLLFFKTLF